ncbi:type IV pilin N-terminal domain-containing protein [Halorhabdus sp. BNX81]|uniref:type IV pilin N-terminal domain-containing protein n=1 Tax=Halorhabdus sp. BNX81 TaxID=2980181 RepID=UPI0023DCEDD3|nr:type IV pilin N-terminal domain-containing protein [Halorhabdus sp. BNX81]WEL21865.1 Pilin/Flagellin, FlaG/FlaF family [Halorhabdus sp. BNX81]
MDPVTPGGDQDERGVSEMTAVVTLVGIAFILVAGVGISAFLFTGDTSGPPQANFTYEYIDGANALLIEHDRGDEIRGGDLYVDGPDNNVTWASLAGSNESALVVPDDQVQVSEASAYGAIVRSSSRFRIIYHNASLNESVVLSRWNGDTGI